ncbi:MAG: hypothetical protein NZ578_04985, partial [Candidatus Binatia bacterium]|nr:hypothetical protein [Candidatus Binatia bacterium]
IIAVFNKLDRCPPEEAWDGMPQPWMLVQRGEDRGEDGEGVRAVAISALTGWGIERLLYTIEQCLADHREVIHVDLPLRKSWLVAWLHRNGKVLEEVYSASAVRVTASVSKKVAGQLRKLLSDLDTEG